MGVGVHNEKQNCAASICPFFSLHRHPKSNRYSSNPHEICPLLIFYSLTTSDFVLPLNFSSLLYSVWYNKPAPRLSPALNQPSNQRTRRVFGSHFEWKWCCGPTPDRFWEKFNLSTVTDRQWETGEAKVRQGDNSDCVPLGCPHGWSGYILRHQLSSRRLSWCITYIIENPNHFLYWRIFYFFFL